MTALIVIFNGDSKTCGKFITRIIFANMKISYHTNVYTWWYCVGPNSGLLYLNKN